MDFMDNLLLVCGIGIFSLLGLNVFLNNLCRFSPAQSAAVSALISIAVLIPLSIIHWPGGDVFAMYLSANLITCYAYYLIGKGGVKSFKTADGKHLHWGPISVLLFFLVLIVVDGTFVAMAERGLRYKKADGSEVSTRFPGEVPNAYQKKEAYFNAYQGRLQAQVDRGWSVGYGFLDNPKIDVTQTFIVEPHFKDGKIIDDAVVVANFIRPADQRQNFSQTLSFKNGRYESSIDFPVSGVWQLLLTVTKNEDIHEVQSCTEVATKAGLLPKRNKYRPNESAGCRS